MTDMEDFDIDYIACPRCSGYGYIDCYCGGDLCVCENYGERDCPLCHGEGEVSEETHKLWTEAKRRNDAAIAAAWAASNKEPTND